MKPKAYCLCGKPKMQGSVCCYMCRKRNNLKQIPLLHPLIDKFLRGAA